MRQIAYTKSALRTLRKIPDNTANLIRSKIGSYAADPESVANNVTALQGRNAIRLRVGDWRVIMNDEGAVLMILQIGPRGGVYR
nr:type II toxin-antitoxin system RelE/ParE family toxin [Salaquimonas pukyongi]